MNRREMLKGAVTAGAAAGIVSAFVVWPEHGAKPFIGYRDSKVDSPQSACEPCKSEPATYSTRIIKITEEEIQFHWVSAGGHNYPFIQTYRFGDHYIINQPLMTYLIIVKDGVQDPYWSKFYIHNSDKEGVLFESDNWTNSHCEQTHFVLEETC